MEDAVRLSLNPVHQVPLVVGLANVCLQAQPLGGFLDQGQEIVVGGVGAVKSPPRAPGGLGWGR